jgi:glucose dehydrogenase
MNRCKTILAVGLIVSCLCVEYSSQVRQQRSRATTTSVEWRQFGGNADNTHYSPLNQINRENVKNLKVAWTYDTGDEFIGSEMECNPIIVDGVLYGTTPKLRVIALDAATGKLRWSFDPNEGKPPIGKMRNRGVTYWQSGTEKRVYFGFLNWLYSLDATTGKPATEFGVDGRVDLREGLGRDASNLTVGLTTPGVIYQDLLIIGSLVSESLPAAPGHIRAYDARSGKQRWIFHTIPQPGEFGYETWPQNAWQYIGGANNWCGMVLDEKRGLVFAPTGSAAFDFYGGNRLGDNLFANTFLCLNARTGKRMWHFQGVKHDVWDRDFPSAPVLITLKRGSRNFDAVAQTTKSGFVFVFDRVTGKPLFPIEYRSVPTNGIEGEKLSATQPFPLSPPPFARQKLTEELLTQRTPAAHDAALERFRKLSSNGQFDPPGTQGTVIFPGFDGGAEWGGPAFDPQTGLLYVNSNEMAWVLRLVKRIRPAATTSGRTLYQANCASCHKSDLTGSPPEFPSLLGLVQRHTESEVTTIVRNGLGRMPGFARLGEDAVRALVRFALASEDTPVSMAQPKSSPIDLDYTMDGYNKFLDSEGYPAIVPPWGTLNAIDLNAGKIVWQIPFGEYPGLAEKGLRDTGSENYGGPVVTAGGLILIGATSYDKKFRAYDKKTGELLWETLLPASGNATPATYEVNGRQFVVIAAGGGKAGGRSSGGSYVAFALPN